MFLAEINKLKYFDKVLIDLTLIYSVTLDRTNFEVRYKTINGYKR